MSAATTKISNAGSAAKKSTCVSRAIPTLTCLSTSTPTVRFKHLSEKSQRKGTKAKEPIGALRRPLTYTHANASAFRKFAVHNVHSGPLLALAGKAVRPRARTLQPFHASVATVRRRTPFHGYIVEGGMARFV